MSGRRNAETLQDFEVEGTRRITFDNQLRIATELGENMTDHEINKIVNEPEKDKNCQIFKDQFEK